MPSADPGGRLAATERLYSTMVESAPLPLYPGSLYALSNPILLDGRVAWYKSQARGYSPVNCYLLTERRDALLVDTGVTLHRDALVAQLKACLPGDVLSIAHTRIAEYPAICNTMAVAERLPVEALYAGFPDALSWLEFRPRADRSEHRPTWALGRPPQSRVVRRDEGIPVGSGGRRVHVMHAAVRLLPSQWFFDDATGTLFTGDMFSHAYRTSRLGPWLADDQAAGITSSEVLEHLLARCWWLKGAQRHAEIQQALEDVFTRYTVQTIAPGYGCIIHGRAHVEHHYDLLQGALSHLARQVAR